MSVPEVEQVPLFWVEAARMHLEAQDAATRAQAARSN